jgi:hypothetical protein
MGSKPSFFQLFKRGRYSRRTEDTDHTGHDRTELFTVAAIGFMLRHDPAFKRHFLKSICSLKDVADLSGYRVECQPYHCSDLAILKDNSTAYIIEAKVDADLADHQKPWEQRFEVGGYGEQIRTKFKDYPEKHYIVLQNVPCSENRKAEEQVGKGDGKINCHFKTWGDLFGRDIPKSDLIADLQDSLGQFDISALKSRRFQNMKNAKNTSEVAEIYEGLREIARSIGITSAKIKLDVQFEEAGLCFFGINIPQNLPHHRELTRQFPSDSNPIGWFGYAQDGKDQHGQIEVWFYPNSKADMIKVKSFVEKRLGENIPISDDSLSFAIGPTAEGQKSDFDWFYDVFKKLEG